MNVDSLERLKRDFSFKSGIPKEYSFKDWKGPKDMPPVPVAHFFRLLCRSCDVEYDTFKMMSTLGGLCLADTTVTNIITSCCSKTSFLVKAYLEHLGDHNTKLWFSNMFPKGLQMADRSDIIAAVQKAKVGDTGGSATQVTRFVDFRY